MDILRRPCFRLAPGGPRADHTRQLPHMLQGARGAKRRVWSGRGRNCGWGFRRRWGRRRARSWFVVPTSVAGRGEHEKCGRSDEDEQAITGKSAKSQRRFRQRSHQERDPPCTSRGLSRQYFSDGRDCRRSEKMNAPMKRTMPPAMNQRVRSDPPGINTYATTIRPIPIRRTWPAERDGSFRPRPIPANQFPIPSLARAHHGRGGGKESSFSSSSSTSRCSRSGMVCVVRCVGGYRHFIAPTGARPPARRQ